RSRHQDVWRPLQHGTPLWHERVAGTNRGSNLGHQQATLSRHLQDFAERALQVLLDVVAQSLKRGNVENLGSIQKIPRERLTHKSIDTGQKGSQSFSGAGWSGDQGRLAGKNWRPSLLLRLSGRLKRPHEPLLNQRMRPSKGGRDGDH